MMYIIVAELVGIITFTRFVTALLCFNFSKVAHTPVYSRNKENSKLTTIHFVKRIQKDVQDDVMRDAN